MEVDIDLLITFHINWKNSIENVIEDGMAEVLNPVIIGKDDECDLGHWINSDESKSLLPNEIHKKLHKLHKEFHYFAGWFLFDYQLGNERKAIDLLDHFKANSIELIDLLKIIKKDYA